MANFEYQDGAYYYRMQGKLWRILRCHVGAIVNGAPSYSFSRTGEDFLSMEAARRRVYELNGWNKKKETCRKCANAHNGINGRFCDLLGVPVEYRKTTCENYKDFEK